jgi:hypothetical protein
MNKPGRALLDPDERELREMLTPLADALTDPDDGRRRDNVARLLPMCPRAVWVRLLDRLVELAASRNGAVRRQARASLLQVGPAAVAALTVALINSRRPGLQRAAAETLEAVAPRLAPDRLSRLGADAMIVGFSSPDESVRTAAAKLSAAVRRLEAFRPQW